MELPPVTDGTEEYPLVILVWRDFCQACKGSPFVAFQGTKATEETGRFDDDPLSYPRVAEILGRAAMTVFRREVYAV